MLPAQSPDRDRLAALVAEALDVADALGLEEVGIRLNDALERLTGQGKPPPGS